MTLERFKDGFSCIPGSSIELIGEDFGMTRGNIMFRDFSDAVAFQVWHHPWRLELVMAVWSHCFSFKFNQLCLTTKTLNQRT
jgi:hypothetical protein